MGWFGSKDTKTDVLDKRSFKEQSEAAQKEIKRIIATPEGTTQALVRALGTPNRKGAHELPDTDPYSGTLRSYAAMALGNFVEAEGGWACCICDTMFESETNAHDLRIYPKRKCSCKVVFDPRTVEPLIKALGDEKWTVRSSAASALGEIGDERAAEPLSKTLKENDPKEEGSSFYVRVSSADALGKISGTLAFNSLFKEFIKLQSPSLPHATEQGPYPSFERTYSTSPLVLEMGKKVIVIQYKRNYDAVAEALKKFPETTNEFERLELYDKAEEWYKYHDMLEEAAAIRRKKADMAAPKTEIHGDYVDDRDTIIKDSVVSKSNVGASGKSKGEQIKVIKDLLDSGAIDDDEFKQMKKEILGK